ncbi:helix-turn-helix domain-containing protein [Flavobacterium sp. I3-2]|uniref:helix-turn-helix domain-containing protein n=1 Tax=Flavobacterium sp. I3-2 TaxID=2748319 RepID=UPI0015AD5624|nr:helix-turn-helix domain-containing protein [Flavobacterium sp. I3-2]
MTRKYIDISAGEFFMHKNNPDFCGLGVIKSVEPLKTLVYNKGKQQIVTIDGIEYNFPEKSFLPLVVNQKFNFEYPEYLVAWQFNREFYCILDHDTEVGCVGFLFYGINHPMFIRLTEDENKEIIFLESRFQIEWESNDRFQGEMLRTLLKHLIIKITRLAKSQSEIYQSFSDDKLDIVRRLSVLIELNYKKEHSVKFYADALNKSPKTLSNIFSILKQQAPSKLIHNRITLEAKRYLNYTDKTAKEIAFELGFEDVSSFSRFFKRNTGVNISSFKVEFK